jgi:hypothetical protein
MAKNLSKGTSPYRAIRIWQTMSFWNRIERTLGILGGSATILEAVFGASPAVIAVTSGFTMLSQSLSVWFDDKDEDGVPDIFQPEKIIRPDQNQQDHENIP